MPLASHSVPPPPEQNFAPPGLVLPHLPHATSVPGCAIAVAAGAGGPAPGGNIPLKLIGCPKAVIVIPSAAAIPAAWIALNSRTRPGMKKHSINPSTHGNGVQQ